MMAMRKKGVGLFFASLLAMGGQAHGAPSSLLDQYELVKDSFLPKTMRFGCGGEIYQIKKGPILGLSLYRKEGLDWIKEESDIQFRDSGLVFESSSNLAIQKSAIRPKVSLPFYMSTHQQDVMNYLLLNQVVSSDYQHTIDFQQASMTVQNAKPINLTLYLDADKYLAIHDSYLKINPGQTLKQELELLQARQRLEGSKGAMQIAIDTEDIYLKRVEQQRKWGAKNPEKVTWMKSRVQAAQELGEAKVALRKAQAALESARHANSQTRGKIMQKAQDTVAKLENNPINVNLLAGENKITQFCVQA